MLQGKRPRRIIAATLLTVMLTNTLAPTVTYALTSGPTAPEATSFEPIDTTDMVNLQTGNFTYNLPLLEVPGPEGGYPLSLSYHAGIQTNEDASWVGLGWTLNPGAINRNVNGYPDDWQGFNSTSRVYWGGGTQVTYSPGVSIGLANSPLSVNVGLSFSNDTYQGFGMTMDVGVGISGSLGSSPLIGNMNLGISSNGQGSLGGGIGAGYTSGSGLSGSLGASVNTNFESLEAGFSGGMGIGGSSLLQASMATNGDKPVLTTGGYSSTVTSSSSAQVQTRSSGWHIAIPTPVPGLSASFGYSKTRYWTDETTNVTTKGSIFNTWNGQDNVAYDNYSLLVDPSENSYIVTPDPTVQQGGAFPAFDNYEVNAQGLSGNMRPYQFQGVVFGQNRRNTGNPCTGANCDPDYLTRYASPATNPTPSFRFVGDFSNRYLQEDGNYTSGNMNATSLLYGQPLPFTSFVTGDGTNNNGFNNNQLAGSKHIDVGIKIKPSQLLGYNTSRLGAGMIEGFSITNSSGVMYTFGLPAYTYNEESYQEKRNPPANQPSFNRQTKNAPYAYTWYLTSITGPDYVDKNGDGYANDGDWGYWVNFEYGKWSDNYAWRTPSEGYNADEDNEWQNCSMGYKEVYYLNAIRTRTHVALFEKEVRADAKGSSPTIFDKKSPHPTYNNPGAFDGQSVSSLRLSHIYLMNASDAGYVTPSSGTLNGNVLDATDIDAKGRTSVDAKAIRIIDFYHDYSLCPGTHNSFFPDGYWDVPWLGKLTLKYISTRGRSGALFPAMKFEYDPENDAVQAEVQLNSTASSPVRFSTTNNDFKVGDLIMSPTVNAYLGVIIAKSGTGTYTYTLANGNYNFPDGATTLTARTTKNPPYNQDAYDAWGMYKSDFNTALLAADLNQGRSTSAVSAPGVDVWSLRSITTELGNKIKINYEPDSYYMPPTEYNKQSLVIDKTEIDQSTGTMTLHMDNGGDNTIKLSDSYVANDDLSAVLLMDYYPKTESDGDGWGGLVVDTRTSSLEFCDYRDNAPGNVGKNLGNYPKHSLSGTLKVLSVDDANNNITVQCTDPFLLGNQKKGVTNYRGSDNFALTNYVTRKNPFGGNLFIKAKGAMQGGGIRVRSLSVVESFTGVVNTTNYGYNDSQGNSSGVSAYTPSLPQTYFNYPATQSYNDYYIGQGFNTVNFESLKSLYIPFFKKTFLKNNGIVFTLARDMPPPGVMYGNVTVSNYIKNPAENETRKMENGKTEFQFEVFRQNMVARVENVNAKQVATVNSNGYVWDQYARYYSIYKFISCMGNTKKVIQYDESGRKLTETINEYLHDDLFTQNLDAQNFFTQYKALLADPKYNSQGYIKERYGEVKYVGYQKNYFENGIKSTIASKEEFPCISKGQTVINYVNGTRTKIENLAYDFYSGDLIKSVETDAYGNQFMTETVPAYRKYPNTELGLKINGSSNSNMLAQTAAKYLYKVEKDVNGNYINKGLVSASATTWSNGVRAIDADGNSYSQNNATNGNVWRIQSTYSWLPNGKTPDGLSGSFTDLNWSVPNSSVAEWKKTSEISLYDVYSHALESSDMNGSYAATRMDYGNKRVILSGALSKYDEIAYSGAEDAAVDQTNDVFVKKVNAVVSTDAAHTGNKSLKLGGSGNKGFVYTVSTDKLTTGRTYIANVWVKPVSGASDVKLYYTVNGIQRNSGSSGTIAKVAGGWSLLSYVINGNDIVPGATLTVGCRNDAAIEVYLDDFRFRPLNAGTSAYVYDAVTGELTYILDNSNLYSKYEYDAAGRLVRTFREKIGRGEIKMNEYQYNYGRPSGIYSNEPQSGTFTKNNCLRDMEPTSVTYSVKEGKYFSEISVDDANNKAKDEVNANGQNYANTRGQCWYYNDYMSQTFPAKCGFGYTGYKEYVIPYGKYKDEASKAIANQMATDDMNANGATNGTVHCSQLPSTNLTLTMAFIGGATPPTIKVTLTDVDHNDESETFTFPAGRTGSVTISVPATHIRLKFSVPAGYENFPVSFQLSPNGGTWSNGNADSQYGIMFEQGTNYTLVASNVL
jgi:hypothetical protein